jgi:hypothetical protein
MHIKGFRIEKKNFVVKEKYSEKYLYFMKNVQVCNRNPCTNVTKYFSIFFRFRTLSIFFSFIKKIYFGCGLGVVPLSVYGPVRYFVFYAFPVLEKGKNRD